MAGMDCTSVSAVQFHGRFEDWDESMVYVGMPGNASRAFGIPDRVAVHGKPWHCLSHPLGWETGYLRYLVNRLATDPEYAWEVAQLHGHVLLCWCAAKNAPRCHAQILAEFVELLCHGSANV